MKESAPARHREIAANGGRAAHARGTAHEFTADTARAAGKKGGAITSANRAHMAEIGRKGGQKRAEAKRRAIMLRQQFEQFSFIK